MKKREKNVKKRGFMTPFFGLNDNIEIYGIKVDGTTLRIFEYDRNVKKAQKMGVPWCFEGVQNRVSSI